MSRLNSKIVLLLILSLFAAAKVKKEAGKNVIISMSVLLSVQELCSFLADFQLIRGAFFATVPFMSYGITNLFASTAAFGLICSAVIEDLKKTKEINNEDPCCSANVLQRLHTSGS